MVFIGFPAMLGPPFGKAGGLVWKGQHHSRQNGGLWHRPRLERTRSKPSWSYVFVDLMSYAACFFHVVCVFIWCFFSPIFFHSRFMFHGFFFPAFWWPPRRLLRVGVRLSVDSGLERFFCFWAWLVT